ncbi:hypothetical protein NL676_018040 [Syzygium grande]|nr:hypothetical protein NL676_018040 [Syzygium grande]
MPSRSFAIIDQLNIVGRGLTSDHRHSGNRSECCLLDGNENEEEPFPGTSLTNKIWIVLMRRLPSVNRVYKLKRNGSMNTCGKEQLQWTPCIYSSGNNSKLISGLFSCNTRAMHWLGMYDTAVEAVMAYDKASRQLCRMDAITNFPFEHSALDSLPPSEFFDFWIR